MRKFVKLRNLKELWENLVSKKCTESLDRPNFQLKLINSCWKYLTKLQKILKLFHGKFKQIFF